MSMSAQSIVSETRVRTCGREGGELRCAALSSGQLRGATTPPRCLLFYPHIPAPTNSYADATPSNARKVRERSPAHIRLHLTLLAHIIRGC